MSKLKVGLAGLGTMSAPLMDAVQKSGDMELYAICTRSADKLPAAAERRGVEHTFTDYASMLQMDDLDAVVVATPNHLHASMTIDALKAGKHVFCEKPPAITADEAQRMADAALAAQKQLMYGLVFRFSPNDAIVRALRDKGMFGDIYYGKAGIVRRCGSPGGWFGQKSLSGGGPLIDLGPHIIDLAMYNMGDFKPVSVFARTFRKTENLASIKAWSGYQAAEQSAAPGDVEEMASVIINAENGACLLVETSYSSHIKDDSMYLSMLGTKGGVSIHPNIEIFTAHNDYLMDIKPRVNCGSFDYGQGVLDEIRHFADCINAKVKCVAPPEVGVTIMRVIEAAYKSAESGELVRL